MAQPQPLSLFAWSESRPQAAPKAPAGVKRAAKAGTRVDRAILEVVPSVVGHEVLLSYVHERVEMRAACLQDTVRRRLHALKDMGLLGLGEARAGHVLVEWVRQP